MPIRSRTKLTEEDRVKVIAWHGTGRYTQANLAKRFGVSVGTISKAVTQAKKEQTDEGNTEMCFGLG